MKNVEEKKEGSYKIKKIKVKDIVLKGREEIKGM